MDDETYMTQYRSYRGGSYNYTGYEQPASYRFHYAPISKFSVIGFRVALYL